MDEPEIENLRGRKTDEQLEAIKDVLDRNQNFFRDIRQTLDAAISLNLR